MRDLQPLIDSGTNVLKYLRRLFLSAAAPRLVNHDQHLGALRIDDPLYSQDETGYEVGFRVRIWNTSTKDFYSDTYRTITAVNGPDIRIDSNFTTTLTTSMRVFFPDYDESTLTQQAVYAYISPDTNEFVSDGKKAYQISL